MDDTITVLVVDDNMANRLLPALILRDVGCVVHESKDAEEALEMFQKHVFSHVLLDISMPRISGIELCKLLRDMEACKDVKVIAYTSHAQEALASQFLSQGFDAVLIKPITKSKLIRLILG
jgi:CheY-like chemotaxis protein